MVSSAVYRYFPSRDDLLTALLVDLLRRGRARRPRPPSAAVTPRSDYPARWLAVAARLPGLGASPTRTTTPCSTARPCPGTSRPGEPSARRSGSPRWSSPWCGSSTRRDCRLPPTRRRRRSCTRALAGLRDFAGADLPDDVILVALQAWSGLIGAVTLEVFGHLEDAVSDHEVYFAAAARRLAPVLASPA